MTEAEWLACTEPTPMLEFLRGKASDRKLRLFACACCRRIWHLLVDEHNREVVEQTEAGDERLSPPQASHSEAITLSQLAVRFAIEALLEDRWVNVPAMCARAASGGGVDPNRMNVEMASQCCLLRDIFGPLPFRPVAIDPAWLRWNHGTVPAVARRVYEDRAFNDLPILADALEDAGCTDADILAHCRSGGGHVRGCWALDLLLGRV
jgi:hypothetical protein